jgi:hypothetical protein
VWENKELLGYNDIVFGGWYNFGYDLEWGGLFAWRAFEGREKGGGD